MKTKRSESKRLFMLNKRTIVNLNHREMVNVRGRGQEEGHLEDIGVQVIETPSPDSVNVCQSPIDTDAFRLSILCN
jgi:hypothetical protein